MPGAWTYRGSLLALAAGAAVTIYLLVSPPEARQSAAAPRPTATVAASPTRPAGTTTAIPGSPTPAPAGTVVTTATPPAGSATPATRTYTVQSGDVLSAIASRFNTTVDSILAVNPGLQPDRLSPGQVITLPGAP